MAGAGGPRAGRPRGRAWRWWASLDRWPRVLLGLVVAPLLLVLLIGIVGGLAQSCSGSSPDPGGPSPSLVSPTVSDEPPPTVTETATETVTPSPPEPTVTVPDPPAETSVPAPPPGAYYDNCDAARAAGVAPLFEGDPGYRDGLDRDGDGVACEPFND